MDQVLTLETTDVCVDTESLYVGRNIVKINSTVLMITFPNMAIRCSMIGSTQHTSLRETDRLDDPPKQASEIVISAYNIEYILSA